MKKLIHFLVGVEVPRLSDDETRYSKTAFLDLIIFIGTRYTRMTETVYLTGLD